MADVTSMSFLGQIPVLVGDLGVTCFVSEVLIRCHVLRLTFVEKVIHGVLQLFV